MNAIIHMGMVKTGSTSIQEWLRSNRAALETERVCVYDFNDHLQGENRPRALLHAIFWVAVHELGADERTAFYGRMPHRPEGWRRIYKNYEFLTDQIEKMSRGPGLFIHSNEILSMCNEIQMIALDKYLSRFFQQINYIVYIRNTVDWLVSQYSQRLQDPNLHFTQEYSKFMDRCMIDLVPHGPSTSMGYLFEWDKVLGDRLSVKLLEPESGLLVNDDLIEDFASQIGVPTFEKPDRMNESFAAEYIEYVRFLNHEFRDNLPREVREKAIGILKDASAGKPKLAASDAEANSIQDIHREQEERIRKRFFPDRPTLFSPKFRGDGVAPAPLTDRRKLEIESEIQEKMAPETWVLDELARRWEVVPQ